MKKGLAHGITDRMDVHHGDDGQAMSPSFPTDADRSMALGTLDQGHGCQRSRPTTADGAVARSAISSVGNRPYS